MALGPLGLVDLDNPPPSLADGLIELGEAFLRVPTGLQAGQPLELSVEQIEFLIAWYAVYPDGRSFTNNRGILEGPKGWSKSPLGGICAFGALVGDVIPDGLDANGKPVGRPHPAPWVQIAGTSEDNTDNLYGQLYEMLRDSPALDYFGIELGVTMMKLTGRAGKIEPVTSASTSREGNPVSEILREETHHWLPSNGGRRLAGTLSRNATKMGARVLDLTNCFVPGAQSVAENTVQAVEGGRSRSLLVRIKPRQRVKDIFDDEEVRAALLEVYGSHALENGGWVDLGAIMDERPPGDTTEEEWRRFYLNEETGDEDAVLDVLAWAALHNEGAVLAPGDTIALGFDGSDVRDATALYAVRWPDWTVFELGVWERPKERQTGKPVKDWKVDRAAVKEEIYDALDLYHVVRGYADPAYWQTDIDEISAEVGESFMRFPHHSAARIGPACERWSTMVADGAIQHDGKMTIVHHAANARREKCGPKDAKWWRPVRRVEGHPIDAFSAAISAVHALGDAIAEGAIGEDDEGEDFVEEV